MKKKCIMKLKYLGELNRMCETFVKVNFSRGRRL